jgi:hypothetical protein
MNELKFSCTKCGQHLTADPAWAGIQIKCPVCKADVTVPVPAHLSSPPLYNYESGSSLPPVIEAAPPPIARPTVSSTKSGAPWLIIALIVGFCFALLVLAAVALVLLSRVNARQHSFPSAPSASAAPADSSLRPPAVARSQNRSQSYRQPPANVLEKSVTTDPLSVEIPATRVSGSLGATPFLPNAVKLEHGILKFGQGTGFLPDSEVLIFLFLNGESPSGKSWTIPSPDPGSSGYSPAPHVHFHWKQGTGSPSGALSSNYAMRLELGTPRAGKIPGKIYLELPEPYTAKVAGTFEAQFVQ